MVILIFLEVLLPVWDWGYFFRTPKFGTIFFLFPTPKKAEAGTEGREGLKEPALDLPYWQCPSWILLPATGIKGGRACPTARKLQVSWQALGLP